MQFRRWQMRKHWKDSNCEQKILSELLAKRSSKNSTREGFGGHVCGLAVLLFWSRSVRPVLLWLQGEELHHHASALHVLPDICARYLGHYARSRCPVVACLIGMYNNLSPSCRPCLFYGREHWQTLNSYFGVWAPQTVYLWIELDELYMLVVPLLLERIGSEFYKITNIIHPLVHSLSRSDTAVKTIVPCFLTVPFHEIATAVVQHKAKVREGISGHGPSFRSLAAVFANNGTASESSKVGYASALTINRKNC